MGDPGLERIASTLVILGCAAMAAAAQRSENAGNRTDYLAFHRIEEAWSISKGAGVRVAVLDWLFDLSPEAAGKYVDAVSLVPGQDIGEMEPWHGEWMAGIVHRIAPQARIIPVRARPMSEPGTDADNGEQPYEAYLVQGIRYAADHGATVVTSSMGPVKQSHKLHEAVQYAEGKGTIFVDVHPEYLVHRNGSFEFCEQGGCDDRILHVGIVSVPDHPVEAVPERDVYTWPYDIDPVFQDGWGYSNGPPIAAGVLALMKAANPRLTVQQLKRILIETSVSRDGFDVIDAAAAVKAAQLAAEEGSGPHGIRKPDS